MPADNLPEIDHVKWFLVLTVGTVIGTIIAYAYKQTVGMWLDNWMANVLQRQGFVMPSSPGTTLSAAAPIVVPGSVTAAVTPVTTMTGAPVVAAM